MTNYNHIGERSFRPRYNRLGLHFLFVTGLLCTCGLFGFLQLLIAETYYPILIVFFTVLILPVLLIPNRFPSRIRLHENQIIVERFVIRNLIVQFKDIVGLDESSIVTTRGRIFYHLFRNADELFKIFEESLGSELRIDISRLKSVEIKERSLAASILLSLPITFVLTMTIPVLDSYPDSLNLFYFAIIVFLLISSVLYFIIKVYLMKK